MRVRLVSKDLSLYQVCREALLAHPERQWDFGKISVWEPGLSADLWIWDCDSAEEFPSESWLREEQVIFVVDRTKLALSRELLPIEPARILLKPVRPQLMQTFLQQILAPAILPPVHQVAGRIRSDRDMLLQHLLEANLTLQEYDQDRAGFLARMAHDLRAPIVAIAGYCGLLLDRRLGPLNTEQLKALDRMQHSAKRMTRLSNAMLQISMGRELSVEPMMKFGDLGARIKEAVGEVTPVAESKRLKIQVDVTPSPESLLFEPWQIEQVLVNLLDNSCRLTPRGGNISIKAYPVFWERRSRGITEAHQEGERRSTSVQKPNAYRVEVRDSGPGLGDRRQSQVFDELRSDSPYDGSPRAGLGLSICHQIISAHKGQIVAEPNENGATFAFVLPFAHKALKRSEAALTRKRTA